MTVEWHQKKHSCRPWRTEGTTGHCIKIFVVVVFLPVLIDVAAFIAVISTSPTALPSQALSALKRKIFVTTAFQPPVTNSSLYWPHNSRRKETQNYMVDLEQSGPLSEPQNSLLWKQQEKTLAGQESVLLPYSERQKSIIDIGNTCTCITI